MPDKLAVFPVQGGTRRSFVDTWGAPRPGKRGHKGTDIFAARGTPCLACVDGSISKIGNDDGLGGNRLWISSKSGQGFYYAHLNAYAEDMVLGAKLKAGQVVGYVGNTGKYATQTPPHLHFGWDPEGTYGANWKNPYSLLVAVLDDTPGPTPPLPLQQRVADLMYRESFDWSSVVTKGRLHKITKETALRIAPLAIEAARHHNVPLAYLLAVVRQESAFDPDAVNPNAHRNPEGRMELTDWGIGQISGTNLVSLFPKLTNEQRTAKAFDPAWALDHVAKVYRSLLTRAKTQFPFVDPLWMATLSYNAGPTGARLIVEGKADPEKARKGREHAKWVIGFYTRFLKELRQ